MRTVARRYGFRLLSVCRTLFILWAVVLAAFGPFSGAPVKAFSQKAVSSPQVLTPRVYLPALYLNSHSGTGIYGYVSQAGQAAAGVVLQLSKRSGTTETSLGIATTDTLGYYSFAGAPTIQAGSGVSYFVRYSFDYVPNDLVAGRLAHWRTQAVGSYSAGQAVNIGNFDIADVALRSPADGTQDTLPLVFKWYRRLASPSDSYNIKLIDSSYVEKYSSPPSGFVSAFVLDQTQWPAGMAFGVAYNWYVLINSPDGGTGTSRQLRSITFLTTP